MPSQEVKGSFAIVWGGLSEHRQWMGCENLTNTRTIHITGHTMLCSSVMGNKLELSYFLFWESFRGRLLSYDMPVSVNVPITKQNESFFYGGLLRCRK